MKEEKGTNTYIYCTIYTNTYECIDDEDILLIITILIYSWKIFFEYSKSSNYTLAGHDRRNMEGIWTSQCQRTEKRSSYGRKI